MKLRKPYDTIENVILFIAFIAFVVLLVSAVARAESGQQLFVQYCATCHGFSGEGNGPAGAYLSPKPRNLTKDTFKQGESFEQILKTITEGMSPSAMPSFGSLPETERRALAEYVLSLRQTK